MIAGPAAKALQSLSNDEITALKALGPKAELHAHLNGSIPLECLQAMARDSSIDQSDDAIKRGIEVLEQGVQLEAIGDFFSLFPAIYALTATHQNVLRATNAVLDSFLSKDKDGYSQCDFLELRTTARKTAHLSRLEYLDTVLSAIELYPPERCALIVSLDFRMSEEEALESVKAILQLKESGRRIVGVDLCGDFQNANLDTTMPALSMVKQRGLPLTVHIAESSFNPDKEADTLLGLEPTRLGHATFLKEDAKRLVLERKTPIEICLTSNLLCKTVPSLDDHHILFWLQHNHPVCICTDDALPFRTTLLGEYALLFAKPPHGLGFDLSRIKEIVKMGMDARFQTTGTTAIL